MIDELKARAAVHAALGEPARLALVDDLLCSDRSPKELSQRHGLSSNLLAHHLDVVEAAGLIERFVSAGDRRRKYVRLVRSALPTWGAPLLSARPVLFLCTHNSARSQLASALWAARVGGIADSAGTHPAPRVHRGAVAAARRAGLQLGDALPKMVGRIASTTQVITVCDRAHEELTPAAGWWHWSIPDPVELGTPAAFDAALADLDARITSLLH